MNNYWIVQFASILWIFTSCQATPIPNITEEEDIDYRPMENPDLFEGDIDGMEEFYDRNAIKLPKFRWPSARIPYVIDSNLNDKKSVIMSVIEHIESVSCVDFVERTDEQDYLKITKGVGCHSKVGKMGIGAQPVSLGPGCHAFGSVLHEMTHAIGFYHEHNRGDRDQYLNVIWDNVREGYADQFTKTPGWMHQLLDDFDFDSIMLYGPTIFSKDFESKTLEPKDPSIKLKEVKDKTGLSASDIRRINKLYCE